MAVVTKARGAFGLEGEGCGGGRSSVATAKRYH